jgi:hypothetical protein
VVLVAAIGLAGCATDTDAESGEAEVKAEQELTVQNFVMHPRIVEVRNDVHAIDAKIADGTYARTRKENVCGEDLGDTLREKAVDEKGVVRKLVWARGGDHGGGTFTMYYGPGGKLRFAFNRLSTFFNDGTRTLTEERVYLNTAGDRFWEVHRRVESTPDGPLPDVTKAPHALPEENAGFSADEEKNPAKVFAAPPACH